MLDLQRPRAARLAQHFDIGLGDRVGIERAVRPIRRVRPPGAANAAIDDEMRDVDALGASSRAVLCARPRNANLPIAKIADWRVALDAGAGAGQQDRAIAVRDHAPCRLLHDQKRAKGRYLDRLAHGFGSISAIGPGARALAL